MPSPGRPSFTATHRMINRIHDHTPDLGSFTAPSCPSRFSDADIFMIVVSDLTNGGTAIDEDFSHFTRGQSYLSVISFFRH
jgi:hypothetical protein